MFFGLETVENRSPKRIWDMLSGIFTELYNSENSPSPETFKRFKNNISLNQFYSRVCICSIKESDTWIDDMKTRKKMVIVELGVTSIIAYAPGVLIGIERTLVPASPTLKFVF